MLHHHTWTRKWFTVCNMKQNIIIPSCRELYWCAVILYWEHFANKKKLPVTDLGIIYFIWFFMANLWWPRGVRPNTKVTTEIQKPQHKYKSHNTNTKVTTRIQKPHHKYKSHNTNTKATTEVNNNRSDPKRNWTAVDVDNPADCCCHLRTRVPAVSGQHRVQLCRWLFSRLSPVLSKSLCICFCPWAPDVRFL